MDRRQGRPGRAERRHLLRIRGRRRRGSPTPSWCRSPTSRRPKVDPSQLEQPEGHRADDGSRPALSEPAAAVRRGRARAATICRREALESHALSGRHRSAPVPAPQRHGCRHGDRRAPCCVAGGASWRSLAPAAARLHRLGRRRDRLGDRRARWCSGRGSASCWSTRSCSSCARCRSRSSLAVALAWLTERTDLPGARLWAWLMVAPLAVPAFVQSYAWISSCRGLHGLPGGGAGLGARLFPVPLSAGCGAAAAARSGARGCRRLARASALARLPARRAAAAAAGDLRRRAAGRRCTCWPSTGSS